MFDRILIANRGEIACRIIQTAQRLGVQTIAVYSDADARARHVTMADGAVRIGAAPVADSYLRGDVIVQAALDAGAQAIHPGYGFLSENPDFVDQVTAAGLVFIGPSADAIRAMGLKDAAKAQMAKAGVPVVPGYAGPDQSPEHLANAARQIGYPVLIKAVAGGGGKGMRLVEKAADFAEALGSAQAEARTAFGNDRVLIESYIQNPRHIEVQVFGDGQNAVHLFERDCSLQRRHQKVIEEAPAPGMTSAMRDAMGAAAVTAAKTIGYCGAGTVEFIVDGSDGLRPDRFWFMEMNTRLQVEHPVTEAITGVDLVEWQLRVAAGQGLPARQSDLAITGHAIEARIYAEDVPAGFLPATGRLAHLHFPPDVRIDSGVVQGDDVSPWYDPMIAKLTVKADDRPQAQAALSRALAATQIAGLTTNLGFLQRLARLPGFASGAVETGLIAAHQGALAAPAEADNARLAVAAICAAQVKPGPMAGFTLWAPLEHRVVLDMAGETVEVGLCVGPTHIRARLRGETIEVRAEGPGWRCDGHKMPPVLCHGRQVTVFGDDPLTVDWPDPLARGAADAGGDAVLAPMPGLVQAVAVSVGETVEEGQRLAVLEAMKMEHVLRAPRGGIVAEVPVRQGAQVMAGDVMVALEVVS